MKIVDRCCSRSSAGGVDGIEVRQDGVPVVASATSLDIIDATVADGGDGVAEITIPSSGVGGIEVDEEGALVVAAATALNFVGSSVTVTDGGSGTATITVTSGGGGGLTQTVVSTDQTATAGNLYTFTGLAADRTLTLPASATAGDQVGVCLADLTYSVTVALNGLRYHTFQNNRILKPGYHYGLVVILTYVDAPVGWVSNTRNPIPATFWDSFATWFDLSDAANATENARIYNRASEGAGAVQGASTFYNKRLQSYRGKRYEGMDFSGGVNSYLNSNGRLVAADHTGNTVWVALFSSDVKDTMTIYAKRGGSGQYSWALGTSLNGTDLRLYSQVSSNGTALTSSIDTTNLLSIDTTYVAVGYYNGTELGSSLYGGAYNGANFSTAYSGGIYNSTAWVEIGSIDSGNLRFNGFIGYAGSANLTYTAAIGAELGAGMKYPY